MRETGGRDTRDFVGYWNGHIWYLNVPCSDFHFSLYNVIDPQLVSWFIFYWEWIAIILTSWGDIPGWGRSTGKVSPPPGEISIVVFIVSRVYCYVIVVFCIPIAIHVPDPLIITSTMLTDTGIRYLAHGLPSGGKILVAGVVECTRREGQCSS